MEEKAPAGVVATYRAGTADEDEVNAAIREQWHELLGDPAERAAVARELGVAEGDLDPEVPPFEARFEGAGFGVVEVAVAFGAAFALGFAKKLGTKLGETAGDAVADALHRLWRRRFRDRVNPPGSGRLGREQAAGD